MNRQTHTTESITFAQLRWRAVTIAFFLHMTLLMTFTTLLTTLLTTMTTLLTRMHSSRMHIARSLTVSPSMHCAGGCLVPGGGVYPPCEQNSWQTLLKILPCPKLRLRAVTTWISFATSHRASLYSVLRCVDLLLTSLCVVAMERGIMITLF